MNSLAALPSSILQSTTTTASSALKAVNSVSNSALKAVNSVSNSALKAVNGVSNSTATLGTNVAGAVNSGMRTMNDTFHDVVNSTSTLLKNVPILNSLVSGSNNSLNSTSTLGSNSSKSEWITLVGTFIMLVVLFLTIFIVFKNQIKAGIDNLTGGARKTAGLPTENVELTPPEPPVKAMPTESEVTAQNAMDSKSILSKLLPGPQKEVFNVSENEYTFYDAEPLCRALGAELATYNQVKDAWSKGADWCNYGWVKGQAAVYPTQKDTWNKLQGGPESEKSACGNPGVNGGYFDNPEMRFGVSCYGVKPAESSNSEKNLMARGTIPRTPATLKVDQQIQEYKNSLDTIGVLPFSPDNWSE
jgi:hypothetical protein